MTETVRLRSHIAQLGKFLEAEEPIGRKIDVYKRQPQWNYITWGINNPANKSNFNLLSYQADNRSIGMRCV